MNRTQLVKRVRSLTRDFTSSIFREEDIVDFLNEGIDRVKQIFPELNTIPYLLLAEDEPKIIPSQYHSLLALFATGRCFAQDERHYQATQNMNEFETKLDEFRLAVEGGRIILKDELGSIIEPFDSEDYVTDNYFKRYEMSESFDLPLDEDLEG